MTDYDVRRIAREIVTILLDDKRLSEIIARKGDRSSMVGSRKAAEILGLSVYTIRDIAPYIGGIKKGSDRRQHWCFDESTLVDNYKRYIGTL